MARKDPTQFQPLLAALQYDDLKDFSFPLLGSPKLDGIRCIIGADGTALSRKLKPIPNRFVQSELEGLPVGLDGELIVGGQTDSHVWNGTQSGIMSRDGEPDFRFHVFDLCSDRPFSDRLVAAREAAGSHPRVVVVDHVELPDVEEMMAFEDAMVAAGYEGIMLRDPGGAYKYGRSTERDRILMKFKRFIDTEGIVYDVVERNTNTNEQERDERGYAKRSKVKEGLVGNGTLGALKCRACVWPDGTLGMPKEGIPIGEGKWVEFEIGSGYDDAQRSALWARRDTDLIGTIHTFKYQGLTVKQKPRFPVWKGERHKDDM